MRLDEKLRCAHERCCETTVRSGELIGQFRKKQLAIFLFPVSTEPLFDPPPTNNVILSYHLLAIFPQDYVTLSFYLSDYVHII